MSKVRNFSEIAPNIAFSEFNFHEFYYSTLRKNLHLHVAYYSIHTENVVQLADRLEQRARLAAA